MYRRKIPTPFFVFMLMAKAQLGSGELPAWPSERKGASDAANRRSRVKDELKGQGGKEKMDKVQGWNP